MFWIHLALHLKQETNILITIRVILGVGQGARGPSLQNSDLCCKCAAVDRFDDVKAVIVWSQKAL